MFPNATCSTCIITTQCHTSRTSDSPGWTADTFWRHNCNNNLQMLRLWFTMLMVQPLATFCICCLQHPVPHLAYSDLCNGLLGVEKQNPKLNNYELQSTHVFRGRLFGRQSAKVVRPQAKRSSQKDSYNKRSQLLVGPAQVHFRARIWQAVLVIHCHVPICQLQTQIQSSQ